MGISSDAILFYGFSYDEEIDLADLIEDEDFQDDEWDDYYCKKHNLIEPEWPKDYESRAIKALTPEESAERKVWREKKEEILSQCGAGIRFHCHGDYPIPYIYAKDSRVAAGRGDVVDISVEKLTIQKDWDSKIEKFCKVMGIEKKPCGWKLVSYMG